MAHHVIVIVGYNARSANHPPSPRSLSDCLLDSTNQEDDDIAFVPREASQLLQGLSSQLGGLVAKAEEVIGHHGADQSSAVKRGVHVASPGASVSG